MRPKQKTHHDGHRHPEADNENLRSVKRTMSLKEIRSIHEEGKAEFNKARSESTRNRRRCGMSFEVNTRLENVRRALNPPPSRPLPPTPPSSSASISRTAHTLPPLRPVSPLTLVDYEDDASARPDSVRRRSNQGQEAQITEPRCMKRLSCSKTALTPPIPPPHRVSVEKKAGIPRPSEDAIIARRNSRSASEQELRVSHASDDTFRRRRQQIKLVTKDAGA